MRLTDQIKYCLRACILWTLLLFLLEVHAANRYKSSRVLSLNIYSYSLRVLLQGFRLHREVHREEWLDGTLVRNATLLVKPRP